MSALKNIYSWLQRFQRHLGKNLELYLLPLILLLMRIEIFRVFFQSGWNKFSAWDSTLYLFEFEYQVPIIPWETAAYLGTATELIVPCIILIGLFTRPFALLLFGFNIIAVVSYPTLWPGGFYDHQLWGLMLLFLSIFGAGWLSVDNGLKGK